MYTIHTMFNNLIRVYSCLLVMKITKLYIDYTIPIMDVINYGIHVGMEIVYNFLCLCMV